MFKKAKADDSWNLGSFSDWFIKPFTDELCDIVTHSRPFQWAQDKILDYRFRDYGNVSMYLSASEKLRLFSQDHYTLMAIDTYLEITHANFTDFIDIVEKAKNMWISAGHLRSNDQVRLESLEDEWMLKQIADDARWNTYKLSREYITSENNIDGQMFYPLFRTLYIADNHRVDFVVFYQDIETKLKEERYEWLHDNMLDIADHSKESYLRNTAAIVSNSLRSLVLALEKDEYHSIAVGSKAGNLWRTEMDHEEQGEQASLYFYLGKGTSMTEDFEYDSLIKLIAFYGDSLIGVTKKDMDDAILGYIGRHQANSVETAKEFMKKF